VSINIEESWKTARPGTPFSNGTAYEMWSANWCDRCLRDAPFRNGVSSTGCPLLLIALSEMTPGEWMRTGLQDYTCIEFRAPGGGGGEPRPRPEPPQMDGLFDRPDRATRMLEQPQTVQVSA